MNKLLKGASLLLVLVTGAMQVVSCQTSTEATSAVTTATTTLAVTTPNAEEEERFPMDYQFTVAVPKAAKQAKTLYQIGEPGNFSDKLTVSTLQGLVANLSEEQILISGGAVDKYRTSLKRTWGCTFETKVDGKAVTIESLLAHYKDQLKGYILASADSISESGNVAISLAGLLGAVVVTPDNQKLCDDLGLDCLLDATDKDDQWLRASEYWPQLNPKIAFEQPLSMAPKLVDLAVMSKSYFSFYNGHNSSEHRTKYKYLEDGAIVFGYNNTLGEYDTVASFSAENIQMIPADHAYNLSTLSGFVTRTLDQKTENTADPNVKKAHTVCIVLSDGDNVQWMTNDFTTANKWWGNPNRGKFKMGWGLPPTAIDIAAPFTDYLYNSMSEKDEFIMQLGGLGYTFPSKWSETAKEAMAEKLSEYMLRSDLRYAEILDDNGFSRSHLSAFTKQEGIEGLFYIDYANYAGMNGKIIWSNGKPAVSARYRLWANTSDGSISGIAAGINRASTDPTKADAYSFIIVHAWSGLSGKNLVEGGNTLDAVAQLVRSLDDDVEVVTPTEFMDRIIANNVK